MNLYHGQERVRTITSIGVFEMKNECGGQQLRRTSWNLGKVTMILVALGASTWCGEHSQPCRIEPDAIEPLPMTQHP